jgi:hypothetical protein
LLCELFHHLRQFAGADTFQHMEPEIQRGVPTDSQPALTSFFADRRKAVRYRLGVPLIFRWQGSRHCLQGDGLTRDISVTGAYVLAATSPPADAVVDVEIYLLGFRKPMLRIQARMKVLRVDDSTTAPGRLGFSLEGDGFHLFPGRSSRPQRPNTTAASSICT